MKAIVARSNWRNLAFAALFLVLSISTGAYAYRSLNLGTGSAMGPGFFPLMLSIVLGLLSAGVAFTPSSNAPLRLAPLKAYALVFLGPIIFALTIRTLGLVIAVSALVFIASFASKFATLRGAVLLTVGFTTFCVAVFYYLLKLPIPLWGALITG